MDAGAYGNGGMDRAARPGAGGRSRPCNSGKPSWAGTATELAAALQTDMKPNALAMRLNVRAGKLLTDYHIRYENSRSHAGRSISLTLEPPQA